MFPKSAVMRCSHRCAEGLLWLSLTPWMCAAAQDAQQGTSDQPVQLLTIAVTAPSVTVAPKPKSTNQSAGDATVVSPPLATPTDQSASSVTVIAELGRFHCESGTNYA